MANPALMVLPLDGSLQGTDRSGVFSAVGAGAVRYRTLSGRQVTWLEEGTTNLIRNPSVEVDLTAVGGWGGATVTRDTSEASSGAAAAKCAHTGGSGVGVAFTSDIGLGGSSRTFTHAADVKDASGRNLRIHASESYTDASTDTNPQQTFTGSSSWQRVSVTGTTDGAKTLDAVRVLVTLNGAQAASDFYTDRAQVEEKPYATSYCDGSLGTGYAWTGTAHASASTRTAATITMDEAGRIDPVSGALAFRYVRDIDTGAAEPILDVGEGTTGKDRLRIRINSSDKLEVSWQSNGAAETTLASTESIAVGTEYWVYVAWSGTSVWVGIDGNALASGTRNAPQNNWGTTDLVVGTTAGSAGFGSFAIYDQPLEAGYRQMVRDAMAAGSELWPLLDAEGSLYGVMDLDQVLSGELMALSAGG